LYFFAVVYNNYAASINLENMPMKSNELIVKCYAEQESGCWVAVCLDFNLASQGDSFEEVKSKLEAQIFDYVHDALVGEDKHDTTQLLSRRAPFSLWLKYYFIKLKIVACHSSERIIDETMPLIPA
jgi:hypothetical protein